MLSHDTKNTSGKGNTKEYLLLHHTATGYESIDGVIRRFTMGSASCHYVVDTDGTIHRFNSDDDILWHAGKSSWDNKTNLNQYSIGIEVIGPLPGFTNAQRTSVRKLLLNLMQKYTIPAHHIIRHKDVAPNRKVDIDDSFWHHQYTTFQAYQQSYQDIQTVQKVYETLFKKEFANRIAQEDTIIQNIIAAKDEMLNVDGTFNLKECIYFAQIGLERVRKELLLRNITTMGRYEEIFKKEFADLIARDETIIKDIDGAVDNCINEDGTLNLRELLYFINIGLERVRKIGK